MASLSDFARAFITIEDRSKEGLDSFKKNVREAGDGVRSLQGYLAALGITATAGGMMLLIKQAVDYAAELKKLHDITNASVESLSIMREVAKLSSTDFTGIVVPALQQLNKTMLEVQAGGGKARDALRALGLEVESGGKLKNSGDFLIEIAEALAKIDDNSRGGFAEKIIKGGSTLLPFMKDLVKEGKNIVAITAEQAELADHYQVTLTKMGIASKLTTQELALGLLPVMNDIAGMFLKSKTEGGGLLETIQQLRTEGRIDEWARETSESLAGVADVALFLAKSFRQIVESIGVVVLDLADFFKMFAMVAPGAAWIPQLREANKAIGEYRDAFVTRANQNLEQRWGGSMTPAMDMVRSSFANRSPITVSALTGGASPRLPNAEADGGRKQLEALITALNADSAKIGEQTRQILEYGKALDEAKEQVVALQIAEGKFVGVKAGDALAQRAIAAARMADASARGRKLVEEQAKAIEDLEKDYAKLQRTADEYIKSLDDQVKLQQFEASLFAESETARRTLVEQMRIELAVQAKLNELKSQGISLGDKEREILEAAARAKAAVVQGEQVAEFKRTMDRIDDSFHESFREMLVDKESSWESFCRSLGVTFKTYVADEIYKAFLRPIVVRMVASVGGAMGMPGAAAASSGGIGGVGDMLSMGNNVSGLFGGAGLFGSTAAYSAATGAGAAQASMLAAQTGVFGAEGLAATAGMSGATSAGLGMIGTALPYVGLALAAYSLLKKDKTPAVLVARELRKGNVSYGAGLHGMVNAIHNTGTDRNAERFTGDWMPHLDSVYDQMAGMATSLGRDPSAVYGHTARLSRFQYKEYGDALPQVMAQLADQLARKVIPNLDKFAQAGETATQTLTRMVQTHAQLTINEAQLKGGLIGTVRGLPGALGITGLQGFQNSLRTSDTLSPLDQISGARSIYADTLRRARAGDLSAVNSFPDAAQQLLGVGRDVYASGPQFASLFREVNTALSGIIGKQQDVQASLLRGIDISIIKTGQDQTFELKELKKELKRLNDAFTQVSAELRRLTK